MEDLSGHLEQQHGAQVARRLTAGTRQTCSLRLYDPTVMVPTMFGWIMQ